MLLCLCVANMVGSSRYCVSVCGRREAFFLSVCVMVLLLIFLNKEMFYVKHFDLRHRKSVLQVQFDLIFNNDL